ncbi:YHYH protein [Luteolibacter marinus]|uniref:YHYH protein n=1 Tax=Luteolibacter marinus TaxID=2776705 RepID=UPI0018693027|nr:YHYH protein [Luteolibacter marinus]
MNVFLRLVLCFVLPVAIAPAHETGDAAHDRPTRDSGKVEPKHQVSIETTETQRIIRSNGWPDHEPGRFPNRGNPNRISEQNYEFRMPLKPEKASRPIPSGHAYFGVALNGVPFEPGTAEVWNRDPSSGWHYQAMSGKMDLGLDSHHAHVQPNGAYHYHGLPTGLLDRLKAKDDRMTLVGWAADGFPMYAVYGYSDASDPKSQVRELKSSYRLKAGKRPKEANGPNGKHDGLFEEDFEYVEGLGDLDELNGREGVTPEFPEGTYYYVITRDYPFIGRSWRGTPDRSFQKGGPGGPGGRGGPPGRRPPPGTDGFPPGPPPPHDGRRGPPRE